MDSQGHERFIEGDITIETIEGVTQTYGKWSLSGTHLMIVLCVSIANNTALTSSTYFVDDIDIPDWIKDKIVNVTTNLVSGGGVSFYGIDWSSQAVSMILAKEDGKIIGNASLSRLPRRMKHRGDFSVSVLKVYWNKGIGALLLNEVIKFAKDNSFEIIDLQVRSDNVSAIHLYEKFGFKKIGTHPSFFKIDNAEISFDSMFLIL